MGDRSKKMPKAGRGVVPPPTPWATGWGSTEGLRIRLGPPSLPRTGVI